MKKVIMLVVLLLSVGSVFILFSKDKGIDVNAQSETLQMKKPALDVEESDYVVNYNIWAKLLKEHVDENGLVDYENLKKNRVLLGTFVRQVEYADISKLSLDEQKTFWINAYNALTLKLIVDNYPLKLGGIRTINWGRPWSIKIKVAGRELSLGDIEHEILRKWDPIDPRIHFAINCASIGCPKLPNKPFFPETLDQQLDFETRRFVNDKQKVRLNRVENVLYHSEIFNWFEEDFLVVAPNILEYIKKYINDDDKNYIEKNSVNLKKIDYDWGLNKQ